MAPELLTPEEFIERLKIGRSTLFDWLAKGILVPGKDFLKVGRILRFVWTDEVLTSLMERSVVAAQARQTTSKKTKPAAAKNNIDWNY